MAKHPVRNNQFTTEEPVVKEEPKHILAEETAEQTEAAVSEESEQEEPKAEEVAEEAHEELVEAVEEPTAQPIPNAEPVEEPLVQPIPNAKMVRVKCDQLYLRPEPNKVGTPLGILEKGNQLTLVETDAKLPLGWIEVATIPVGTHGYVMKEFVEHI
jgi:hypothetical protein